MIASISLSSISLSTCTLYSSNISFRGTIILLYLSQQFPGVFQLKFFLVGQLIIQASVDVQCSYTPVVFLTLISYMPIK